MIIYHGISLILLSFVALAVGMFKPKWIFFWMDNPSRLLVMAISMVLFMIGFTMYGEGNKEKIVEQQKQIAINKMIKPVSDTPAPLPSPPKKPVDMQPASPAPAPETSANELRP